MSRKLFAVVGDPVSHSLSPLIHNRWIAEAGLDAHYSAIHLQSTNAIDDIRALAAEYSGLNVTLPHKIAAAALVDMEQSGIGAINCVRPEAGALIGSNSDIEGILAALPPSLMPPGSEVCLIGTGGAARAALAAMKRRGVGFALISARNADAGRALLDAFGLAGAARPLDDRGNIAAADVIINATSLGLAGGDPMPEALLRHLRDAKEDMVVFDMVYAPLETDLLGRARAERLRTVDGLEMLIGQAAAAFELFFGVAPPRGRDSELRAILTK